jgi:hypothetical protein
MGQEAGAPAAVDELTAWALGALPHADDQSVLRWFAVLQHAYDSCRDEGDPSWEALRHRIGTAAAEEYGDLGEIEPFLDALSGTGQGGELVERMVQLHPLMPALYWQVVGGGAGAPAADADGFSWMTSAQHEKVASWWAGSWEETLSAHLDDKWGPGWQQHPAEHKVAWLDGLISEWSGQLAESGQEAATGHETATGNGAAEGRAAEVEPQPELVDEMVESALKEALAEIPGTDLLSPEEIAELRAELRAELFQELGTETQAV